MSFARGLARRSLAAIALRALLAVCALVLLGSALVAHGPACDGKLRTECTACTLDAASGAVRTPSVAADVHLAAAGAAEPFIYRRPPLAPRSAPIDGRAPPA